MTLEGTVGVVPATLGEPAVTSLSPAAPNPVRRAATIEYAIGLDIAAQGPVDVLIELHDLQGRRIQTLKRGREGIGRYRVTWNGAIRGGAPTPLGVYYLRLRAGSAERVTRLVVIE